MDREGAVPPRPAAAAAAITRAPPRHVPGIDTPVPCLRHSWAWGAALVGSGVCGAWAGPTHWTGPEVVRRRPGGWLSFWLAGWLASWLAGC